jgi:hypothetical protein
MLDFFYDPPNRPKSKPWKWILVDSAIIAGIAFLSTLPTDRLPDVLDLYLAVKAFMYAFLIQLAVERGLKPYISKRKNSNEEGGE